MKKEILMTPGPSQVPHRVAIAGAAPMMHHRSAEFKKLYAEVIVGLKKLFGTEGHTFVMASSGTGAMEACVVNTLSPGDKVLVAVTGKFGERFVNICKAYGVEATEIVKEWGECVSPAEIEAALAKDSAIKAVFVTHSETSTGVQNPIDKIGPIVDKAGALFIVDTVSAVGALEVRMDEWKIDLMAAGSQKALMMPPGAAVLAVRGEKAWAAYAKSTIPKFYFDMGKYKKIFEKSGDTPFTTPVSLCLNMKESLDMLFEEGLENVYARHDKLARATRAAVLAMGLELFSKAPSNIETVLTVPAGVDGDKLVKHAREKYGVRASGGQEPFKGKIVRIAHMGYATGHDVILAVSAIEMSLSDMGFKVEPGAAVRAAQEVLRNEA